MRQICRLLIMVSFLRNVASAIVKDNLFFAFFHLKIVQTLVNYLGSPFKTVRVPILLFCTLIALCVVGMAASSFAAITEVVISAETIRDYGQTSSQNTAFVTDADASNGLAFQFIGGANNPPVANPTAWWEVEFWCEAGTYYIWARGKSDGGVGTDAFWLQFDDQIGTTDHTADWGLGNWRDVFDAGVYRWISQPYPTAVTWTTNRTGLHRVRAQPREAPHYLDQLLISQHQNEQPADTAWPTEFPRRDPRIATAATTGNTAVENGQITTPPQDRAVDIPDPHLRAAIESALDKPSGDPITASDMAGLTRLSARNANITNLTGLEGATNLTSLDLGAEWTNGRFINSNSVSNLSPLANLTNLEWLFLGSNAISDIAPLANLTNLEGLFLESNTISDIAPLANLTNLTGLYLYVNSISDIAPLANLTNLEGLFLESNAISDIAPLANLTNLTGLGLGNNAISDIAPLANLTNLTGLSLNNNAISDISPLANLTNLERLFLESNTISDIAPLANLTNLTGLSLNNNAISDIAPLANLTNLTGLSLNNNAISDIAPLANLTNLTYLYLNNNAISDLSPLVANTGLADRNRVHVWGNPLSDASIQTHIPALQSRGVRVEFIQTPTTLLKISGTVTALDNLLIVEVRDNRDLPFAGVPVTFTVVSGGGTLSVTNATTGPDGRAESRFTLGPNAGTNTVRANAEGISESVTFSDVPESAVDIPDLHLRAAIESALDKPSGDPITASDMARLTRLSARNANISNLTGLEGATNLTYLYLNSNAISDLSPVVGLTNLHTLLLEGNSITDLSPLAENTGLGEGDTVRVKGNPLNYASIYTHIPILQSRGVEVSFDDQPADLPMGSAKATLTGHTSGVVSVAFSSRGMIASGSNDNTARLWNPVTESTTAILQGHNAVVRSVGFSPDGTTLASGSHDHTIILWDVATQQPKNTLTEHTAPVETVAFSRDGSTLASGSHDGTVILWEVATGQSKATLTGHTDLVWSLAFSPDGTLAIGRNDGTILLWDVANGQPKNTLRGHTAWVEGVAFSPDGSTLASGSLDTTVQLWDVATGGIIHTFTGHTAGVNGVAFSLDGATLASGADDNTIILWDAVTGQPKELFTGHTSFVRSVAFSPEGTTLASGSGDSTIILWEIEPPILPEYTLSIPAGISLIHVPLKVTTVDGVTKTIASIADLYDALGGADTVNFLVTHDSQTQEWRSYFGAPDKGTPADRTLTDDTGIVAGMKAPVSLRLSGTALGTNGNSTITLTPGLNFVGIPLRDERINRVSDLFRIEGIGGNVSVITLNDGGEFKVVGRAGDPGDIAITGGQAFILNAGQTATVAISGEAWTNVSEIAAAPSVTLKGIKVRDTTPVLGLRGSVVDEEAGLKVDGFRVTVKNLSTGSAVTGMTKDEGARYRLTVVDIETARAATIGDILEISAQSPQPFIGIEPLRYTVTAEDVKRSQIQLPKLVVYEIPAETELLRNYPNPFNPETWMPYRLAEDAFVTLAIYDQTGKVVRTLDVGHRVAAVYESRSKAIYWDGRNEVGESVASGIYFYHLSAGDYSATRKMLIVK